MKDGANRFRSKFKTAAFILIIGLIVQATTLHWATAASFLGFIGAGAVLVLIGIAIYLFAIVSV